jgi:hypothetical protein
VVNQTVALAQGSLRAEFCLSVQENVLSLREIFAFWFGPGEALSRSDPYDAYRSLVSPLGSAR